MSSNAKLKVQMAMSRANKAKGMAKGGAAKLVKQAAKAFNPVKSGDVVSGYTVREEIPNRSSIGSSLENYTTQGLQEVPMSAFGVQGKPSYYSKSTKDYTLNLADQIRQNKELNPLIVVKDKEGYYVLEGGHRFDALRELDAPSFPALVVEDLGGMAKGGAAAKALSKLIPEPTTSRIDMNFKDVTKRTPELQDAANRLAAGEISADEYAALVSQYKPVTPYNFVPTPATQDEALGALTANKREKWGAANNWQAGTPVGLRLDIPAYSNHGVWVNSIHGPDSTAYGNVSSVKDATFGKFDEKALRVAQGEAKSPFAKIEGKWDPVSEAEAVARANEYLKSPEWRQVGMDPERHGYFYDRETMQPIVSSEEVLQIGPLVLAKKPVYGSPDDFKFAKGGSISKALAKSIDIKTPKVESPAVMTRSDVTDLARQIGAREGTYGAQRVERAADEIPDLEKIYTREALLDAFTGDNARALMTMKPADFEKYAAPLDPFFVTSKAYSPEEGVGKMSHDEYIKYLTKIREGGGFNDVPYLYINKEEQGLPLTPFITGHEGRHRNREMAQSGLNAGLVKLLPRAELREPFPRRYQDEYIDALRKEMAMTGNKVLPQTYTEPNPNSFDDTKIRRPAIDLPDLYAKGGAVKMAGGGMTKAIAKAAKLIEMEKANPNLAKYMEGAAIPQQLYHATTATEKGAGQEALRNLKPSKEGALGSGIYMTPDTNYANQYAQGAGGNVLPLYTNMKNPLVITGEHSDPMKEALIKLGVDPAKADTMVERAYEEKGYIGKQVQSRAQAQGYDGLAQFKDGELSEVVSYNPNAVKSAIGNTGEYDPFSGLLGKAKGGSVKKMAGGGLFDPDKDPLRDQFSIYSQPDFSNSPVIEARKQSPVQKTIGTLGGYMDRAGKFINESLEPIAENNPIKTGLVDFLIADPLRSAGTALQDYTGTSREITEDQPYARSPIYGGGTLQTFKVDPRMLDVAGFAFPMMRGTTRLASKGVDEFGRPLAEKALTMLESGADPLSKINTRMTGMQGNPAFMGVETVSTPAMRAELDAKKLAPADNLGFYSPAESVALNLQRKSGQGQAFLNDLKKGGVKDDEIEWTGLGDFLRDKKDVTADEVRDYVTKNKINLREVRYGSPEDIEAENIRIADKYGYEADFDYGEVTFRDSATGEGFSYFDLPKQMQRDLDNAKFKGEAKYGEYALPGGENYREILLKLPPKGKGKDFYSNHYDDPNVLAHMRVQDFTDADGKKMMLIDEIQSDWHQAGRNRGYNIEPTQDELKKIAEFEKKSVSGNITMAERAEWAGLIKKRDDKVFDAPFKDNWHELAMKQAIKQAVDKGYDRVGLVTGARQNERYDLSKQIDQISYYKNSDGTYDLTVRPVGSTRDTMILGDKDLAELNEKQIEELVGKDVAKKIVGDQGSANEGSRFKSLSGLDLQVGGKGMKTYYDEIYPSFLKKFAKKHNADFGQTTLPQAEGEPVRYLEITPSMRAAVKKGLPYKKGGKVSFAKSLDAMRLELTKAK